MRRVYPLSSLRRTWYSLLARSALMFTMLSAFAQFERALIKERQREGIALAKAEGKYRGRKPVLSPEKAALLRQRVTEKANKSKLAEEFGISRETLYQYLREGKVAGATS